MEFEIYSTAGISITQGEPRGDCPVGFILLCVCVCVCMCMCARARACMRTVC